MHKFLSMYLFLFITLYMFLAPHAHHQERQIVSIQPLVTVRMFCFDAKQATQIYKYKNIKTNCTRIMKPSCIT